MIADWDLLRVFLAVAETGSLSVAANTLNVSAPTVGRRIGDLEAQLGTRLFDKSFGGYSLTEAGTSLVHEVAPIRDNILAAQRRVECRTPLYKGTVRISTTESISTYWLPLKLEKLRIQYPEILPDLRSGASLDNILKGDADIAIRLGNPVSQALVGRRVSKIAYGLFCTNRYVELYGAPQRLSDLKCHSIMRYSYDRQKTPVSMEIERMVEEYCVQTRGFADSLVVHVNTVLQDHTMTLLPVFLAKNWAELVRVFPEKDWITADVWLLTHPDLQSTARIRATIDFLYSELKDLSGGLAG